jgi:DNA-binding HxlR family transcriptional regulator
MATRRTYGDRCGIARALDAVGERWALLVVRELLLGPKRFTDLRAGIPNVGPDLLSQRLRELEQAGILQRRRLPPPAATAVYELTDRGRELEPVVLALGRWGSAAPFPGGEARLGPDAFVIALKTLFDPSAAAGMDASYELRLGEHKFHARVVDGQLHVAREAPGDPVGPPAADHAAATIDADPGTLSAVLWHGRKLADSVASGDVRIGGSKRAANRFLRLFPLPAQGGGRTAAPVRA